MVTIAMICQKHGVPFETRQNDQFASIEDVMLWMIDNHLARRSVSNFQRGVLALRKKEIISERRKQLSNQREGWPAEQAIKEPDPVSVEKHAKRLPKWRPQVNPLSLRSRKYVKAATPGWWKPCAPAPSPSIPRPPLRPLPTEQQVAAVAGAKELQQAARQLRESRTHVLRRKCGGFGFHACCGQRRSAGSRSQYGPPHLSTSIAIESSLTCSRNWNVYAPKTYLYANKLASYSSN